jgi:hypothetical protein
MPWERKHRGIPLQFDETAGRLVLKDFERSVELQQFCRSATRKKRALA